MVLFLIIDLAKVKTFRVILIRCEVLAKCLCAKLRMFIPNEAQAVSDT